MNGNVVHLLSLAVAYRVAGAMLVFLLTWIVARFAGASIASLAERSEHRLFSVSLYSSLVQGAILLVGLLTVLGSLGIAIAPLLTTLGLGGLAVALALNDTLSNLFAGVQVVAAKQIRPGDYVKFDLGVEGYVTDIKWHNTAIRDLQNNLVIIPNAKVNTAVVTNYSMSAAYSLVPVTATIAWKGSYADLEERANRAAHDAVTQVCGEEPSERTRVFLSAVTDASVQITVYLPAMRVDDRQPIAAAFLSRLYDCVRAQ